MALRHWALVALERVGLRRCCVGVRLSRSFSCLLFQEALTGRWTLAWALREEPIRASPLALPMRAKVLLVLRPVLLFC